MEHLLFLIPVLPLIGFAVWAAWAGRQCDGDRSPLTDRLLRPAGHSLSLKVKASQEQILVRLAFAALLATGSAGIASVRTWWGITILVTAALVEIGILIKLRLLLFDLRSQYRGLVGEQAVGETLGALRADGCHVFHDLVHENGQRSFNIDHIVVGPQGVFAVETKYRRKPRTKKGRASHEVNADADTLHFPTHVDHEAIPQAERNAQWLAGFLKKATAESVKVQPILTLPGWWINVRERNGVPVMNEKQLAGFVRRSPKTLRGDQIQRIVHQLDQRCRDVEV